MFVTFITDPGNADGNLGGAELTMREFAEASSNPLVEVPDAETVVIGNCTSYGPDLINELQGKKIVWYHNDLSPHIHPTVKGWLDSEATHIFCSPLQRDKYGLDGHLIPPAIDLKTFRASQNGHREGAVSIGSWQNAQKGQQSLLEYAQQHGPIDVYGTGPYAPTEPPLDYKGPLEPDEVPEALSHYTTFVHLPWAVEPFGRCVVEAWASGCALIVNRLVGATWWIKEAPEKLTTASEDFWRIVCG